MASGYNQFGPLNPNRAQQQEYLQLVQAYRKLRVEYERALGVLHQHELAQAAHTQQVAQLEYIIQQAQARIAELQNELEKTRQAHARQQAHDLQKNVEQAQTAANEWREQIATLRTEMDEQRKRLAQRVGQSVETEQRRILMDMLPIADHLELAVQYFLKNDPDDATALAAHYRANLDVMRQAFLSALRHYSIERINAEAQPFDPHLHEAVGQMPSETVPNEHVVQMVQSGYRQHDVVLRPAQVLVSSGAPAHPETARADNSGSNDDAAKPKPAKRTNRAKGKAIAPSDPDATMPKRRQRKARAKPNETA